MNFIEAFLYCINNILNIKAIIEPENLLNEIINNSVFTLFKLLNREFQEIFFNNLIDALTCKFL